MTDSANRRHAEANWSTLAKILHWLIAAMIIVQVVLAKLAERAEDSDDTLERLALIANHKSLGLTVLLLVIVRIGWRLTHRPPPLPASTAGWQRMVSHLSHAGLYLLMLALPLTGWFMAATSAYGLSWFNLFEVPRIMSVNKDQQDLWKEFHEILGYVLIGFVLVHVAAAAFHHLILKDSILKRMSSRVSVALFVVMFGGLLWLLTPGSDTASPTGTSSDTGAVVTPGAEAAAAGAERQGVAEVADSQPDAELWNIDYERSFIRFTGEQAGAQFSGLWTAWQADMRFDGDPDALRFDVKIDVDKVNSDDDDRDSTLKDSDWFDVTNYPVARFLLETATKNANGSYTGTGRLTIKGNTTPTGFTFSVDRLNGVTSLTGQARLDRLALDIGTGEWADTSWVGQYVDVDVTVITR